MKSIMCLFVVILFTTTSYSQDVIFKRNGSQVKAKITEIGTSEIKYKVPGNPEGPVYAIDKSSVNKIVYQNGREEVYVPDLKDMENYSGQLTKAIKIDFFSPLLGFTQISFEKSLGVGKSYELSLGIIGLGKTSRLEYYDMAFRNVNRKQLGAFVSAGYKFNKLPDFIFERTRFTHIMQGGYVKPIFYLGNYSENQIVYKSVTQSYNVEKQNTTFGALQIEFGNQWVFGDKFLLDVYWGFGYGADNKSKADNQDYNEVSNAYNYGNARLGKSPGFSTTFGLKAGLLIK